ncbi:MAG: hypothetical protein CME69_12655 [Halobacteriovorax sp.]|nr:hypothetical protein [Halobacteriovorax sp.]
MDMDNLESQIRAFNKETHGRTDYYKDNIYIVIDNDQYAPISYLEKKVDGFNTDALLKKGYIYDSLDLIGDDNFSSWYEKQFSRKLKRIHAKNTLFLHIPDNKSIFDAIETVNKSYEILRDQKILFNGKKLPVQLGEWLAKCIFGLIQKRSTSQRGFDFFIDDKRVEVKVVWGDKTSPKGVKLRKSLVDLSDYVIVIYLARNLMIREVCFLDSDFILRKFSTKGHTIFLKDVDISSYFFSKSAKHSDKVINVSALMKYSLPNLAMKLTENFKSE